MSARFLFACWLLVALLAQASSPGADPSTTTSDDAVVAAKSYIDRLKTGDVKQAVRDWWHADVVLQGSFGLMYAALPEEQRTRAREAFADYVAAPFANSRLAEMFKTIEVADARAKVLDASNVAVGLQLTGDAGRFKSQNTLMLTRTDQGWRIVDQQQGDHPSIRAALAAMYMSAAKSVADTVPAVLERQAAALRQQATQQ